MLVEFMKNILFYCSCICIITTPLTIAYFDGRHKAKKTKTCEEYESYKIKNYYEPFEKFLAVFMIVSGILGPLYSPIALFGCGNTKIGSLFEKLRYSENYYVYMRNDASSSKIYKLEATIRRDKYGDDEHEFEGYYIEELRFNNGNHITFLKDSETPNPSNELKPYEEKSIMSLSGEEYQITLTKEKAKNNKRR